MSSSERLSDIVNVQFQSKYDPDLFSGREYSYRAAIKLFPGDVVVAPAGNGESVARVIRVNVPESKVDESVLPLLKTIERLHVPEADEERRETIDETLAALGGPEAVMVVSPDEL